FFSSSERKCCCLANIKWKLAETIASCLPEMEAQDLVPLMEIPPNPELGDLSLPCFRLSKTLKKPPQLIAKELQAQLQDEIIAETNAVNGYLNSTLNPSKFARHVIQEILTKGELYGASRLG